ncbi:family 78 glycoside hydrolase catalytic domain [Ereboglobus luteus]|uniref:alpha-L-rhamnosidase n=1 Tax=Ereboglobus luteus TaxID=1796921 RepID=A0A2U8E6M6_9BACT|nr:family 78 glycoside hydrolase catalytic domain [Ereboglobus luteus]AWI10569.1 alpha-L-rhamnosidase [Ereboglobus luteus]
MKKTFFCPFLVFLFCLFVSGFAGAQSACSIKPVNLRTEYLDRPEGLDERKPRFGWAFEAANPDGRGQGQTAYRVIVKCGECTAWDSDWVASNRMQQIEYQGKSLKSDRRYTWTLLVKDENGIEAPPAQSEWTTGLFEQSEWSAKWIGSDEVFDYKIGMKKGDCNIADPWLRKTFMLNEKPGRAVLFVASVGYHELYVNGKQIDSHHVLSPAATDHTKRARYIAYDIAGALQPGKNAIVIWLGASWSIFPGYITENLPRTPIVRAQADIYKNRSDTSPLLRLQTDETWKTLPSPNRLLGSWDFGNMGGEIFDGLREQEMDDFSSVSLDDTNWKSATVYNPKLQVTAQRVEKNRLFDEIRPVAIEDRGDGVWRVDMGVNFAGWTEIKIAGNPGDRIDFLFSERLQNEMTFRNRSAYIIGASGRGVFRNRFNYSSGRWITIKGLKARPVLDDIRGWNVRTDAGRATTFECSDPLQNWIYDRVCWIFENLSIGGMVVDCPQRERMGYGGDAHATAETAMYNYRMAAFYTKWLEDWRDVQGTEAMVGSMNDPDYARKAETSGRLLGGGIMPHTAPTYWGGGGPGWGGICVVLPWYLYQHEGDARVLETNFDMIKKWLAFLDTHVEGGLLKRFGGKWDFLGDWLWPNATAEGMNNDSAQTLCLNNCYRVYNIKTAAKIARVLGREAEAAEWENQARVSSRAIHEKYYNAGDSSYADGSMACLAGALLADVMPSELRGEVMQRLEYEILVVRKGRMHAGITAGAMLFKVLRDEDRHDLLHSMTSQTDYPSWDYMRENGATTLWEMWEKDLRGHSLLHSSYLFPGAWYVDGIAGIKRDPEHPGFQHFIIRPPHPGDVGVTWAKAAFDSPAGLIRSAWEIDANGNMRLRVSVPPNTSATIFLPDNKRCHKIMRVGAGNYTFQAGF